MATETVVDAKQTLFPKESAELITKEAKDVSVIQSGCDNAAKEIFDALQTGRLSLKNFKQSELHPKTPNEDAINWIFVVDTLNFSFWSGKDISKCGEGESPQPKWEVRYKDKVYTGYFALCAAINRAIYEDEVNLTNPEIYGNLTMDDIHHIFRSETSTPIPLPEDRIKNLKEAGQVLLSKYSGSFVNCVKASGRSARKLLELVVTDFPCYRDQSPYNSATNVSFFKRAQILIADIWACFEGQGLGAFDDISSLTMFADYRIPQVLLHFGALKYSDQLYSLLERDEELASGDRREVEIRGASIQAVELINEKVRSLLGEAGLPVDSINSILIDHYLWDFRREHAESLEKYPFHKTRCIYY